MFQSKLAMGVLGAIALLGGVAQAGELGDTAQSLDISEWVKGEKTDVTDGKNIYVVEFWEISCPACRTVIPYLTEVQKKYADKGVKVIGISSEDSAEVKKFVAEQGDTMSYTVAVDNNRNTDIKYMMEFGGDGIPHAFIIDRSGKIVWHGHPMDGLDGLDGLDSMEAILDRVISSKHDVAALKKRQEQHQEQKLKDAKTVGLLLVFGYVMENMMEEEGLRALLRKRVLEVNVDHKDLEGLKELMDQMEKIAMDSKVDGLEPKSLMPPTLE